MKSPFTKKQLLTRLVIATVSIAAVLAFSLSLPMLLFNVNTMHTVSSFGFIDGYARVHTDYTGYESDCDIAINIKIERKKFMTFSEEIANENYTARGEVFQDEFFYPLDKDGIYRCTVTYTVTSASGEDVITFRDIQTYRAEDYPEHTHVWGEEAVIENASCSKIGKSEKTCRCGEKQSFEITQTPHTPGEFVVTLAPTGGKDGIMCQYCEVCKQILAQESIPATGSVGLTYSVNADGETCTVTGMGTCTDKIIVIHEYIDGYRVTAIGKDAFRDSGITGVKLPNSVTVIESGAFFNCAKLASVKLSSELKEIGESAFYLCSQIKKLELPDTLTTLGKSAFAYMEGLFSIEIPSGVTEIPEGLFY
jgi:hypothetical protein